MRDKRAIIIRNPELQKIRNSLRDVFYQAGRLERNKFHKKWREYLVNSDGTRRSIRDLSPDELKKFRELQEQENSLNNVMRRSILMCVSCGRGDRNMVYNKSYDAWYCTECYEMHHSYAVVRSHSEYENDSEEPGHEDKAMDELSRSFL